MLFPFSTCWACWVNVDLHNSETPVELWLHRNSFYGPSQSGIYICRLFSLFELLKCCVCVHISVVVTFIFMSTLYDDDDDDGDL